MADTDPANGRGTIACLLTSGFEDSEFKVPYDRLRAAGYAVEIIGTKAGETVTGYKGHESARVERAIGDVDPEDYEGLLIPGGFSPDKLRGDDRFVDFVKRFDATGRPLAAVCHGPQLLLTAELQRGRTLTAWKTVQGDLRQAGANVVDQEVVVDRNWITSRKPEDLEAFSAKMIEELGELEERGGWRPRGAVAEAPAAP
jgi:protease I